MTPFSPFPIFAVLVSLLLAGCMSDKPTEFGVEALRNCPFTFPDNSSVDCNADVGTIAAHAVPNGWQCVEEGKTMRNEWWQLWTDGQGKYGVRGHTDSTGDRVSRIRFHAEGSPETTLAYHHGSDYFATLGNVVGKDATVDWWLETYNMTGTLKIGPTTIPAEAHVSDFDGDLWFVWAFESQNGTYFAQSMGFVRYGPLEWWAPSHLNQSGRDFQLTVRVWLPVSYHGGYIPDEPSLVPDVPWPDPLPGGSTPRCTM